MFKEYYDGWKYLTTGREIVVDLNGDEITVYEPISARYFKTTAIDLFSTINRLNKIYRIKDKLTYAEFEDIFNLPSLSFGSRLYWNLKEIRKEKSKYFNDKLNSEALFTDELMQECGKVYANFGISRFLNSDNKIIFEIEYDMMPELLKEKCDD